MPFLELTELVDLKILLRFDVFLILSYRKLCCEVDDERLAGVVMGDVFKSSRIEICNFVF